MARDSLRDLLYSRHSRYFFSCVVADRFPLGGQDQSPSQHSGSLLCLLSQRQEDPKAARWSPQLPGQWDRCCVLWWKCVQHGLRALPPLLPPPLAFQEFPPNKPLGRLILTRCLLLKFQESRSSRAIWGSLLPSSWFPPACAALVGILRAGCCHEASLKSALVKVFTPQNLTNATNQGSFLWRACCSNLPAHRCMEGYPCLGTVPERESPPGCYPRWYRASVQDAGKRQMALSTG